MLWHIELKCCIWLSFYELQINLLSLLGVQFEGVMPPFDVQFGALSLFKLWDKTGVFNLNLFFTHHSISKVLYIITFKNFHDGRIMHRLRCFGILRAWFKMSIIVTSPLGSGSGQVVKLLACGARGPGFDSRSRHLNFRDWLSPASKSRCGWNTAEAT